MSQEPTPELPDPNGPPRMIERTERLLDRIFHDRVSPATAIAIGGLATVVLLVAMPSRTMGALRSHRIQWEQREKEIAQAIAVQSPVDGDTCAEQAGD